MHRWTLLAALALVSIAPRALGQSPIHPGVLLLGGNLRLRAHHDISTGYKEFGFEIEPQFGLFVLRGLAVSANPIFGWTKPQGGVPTTYIGIGPGLTYYVSGLGSRFYPYGGIRTFYLYTHREGNIGTDEDPFEVNEHYHEWMSVLAVGGALFVARNVALTAEAYYSRSSSRVESVANGQPISDRRRSEEFGMQVGVRVFLY